MKKIHLAFDMSWTNVETQWRQPGSWVGPDYPSVGLFEDMARLAERGGLDMIFFGDGTGIPDTWEGGIEDAVRYGVAWPRLDMSPWITLMSRVTSHVGFGLTYASTFMHPFYTARLLNSLDHVTNGRMAFNVVTSQRRSDYANYGYDELVDHNSRYDRLEEFVDVCRALWDSLDPDAFVWDRATGQVADPAKVRPINHHGQFFKVKGPLSVLPSPQRHPVVIQAGGSPRGTRAAAHVADHVFGLTKSVPLMQQQRSDLDAALRAEGRDPEDVGILWSMRAIVADTEAEAQALRERLIDGVSREAVGVWLSHNTGFDMSTLPQRFTLSELQARITAANASPVGFVALLAKEYGQDTEMSLDDFFEHGLRHATGYAITMAGTAKQVADRMEEMFEGTGSRGGFMISISQASPRAVPYNIVTQLVPELQRRGRYRTAYEGRTLKENLAS
ncbi:NtaA/DmoA family FMN-dependent monooxygenase [Aquabacter spiritensis]|uniref:FMN-dependent oxidoreductase (Nitrilotriacetate monooxygenase family) n=1 Tax=Aquabacter spiritensis TaxID=933073 RepID=A0A4V2UY04_9HYPH|nr:NtaA/DmoA family FMN-dependent monooxygenase [Aquabacter spiritensis]TCT05508.1 FMN-dependent oxidoreductase (nitrilotriacetate monooxygenase family) [Aquabacter spiritensis]